MKRIRRNDSSRGFTLLELLLVFAIVAILAALLLPTLEQARARSRQVQCMSQLKEIGNAFHLFAHDHDGKFPGQVSTNEGGTMEHVWPRGDGVGFPRSGVIYSFRAISNELNSPALFLCPSDRKRTKADTFVALHRQNISYALCDLSVCGDTDAPLMTDRNLEVSPWGKPLFPWSLPVVWNGELHEYKGNFLFSDGHVEKLDSVGLQNAMKSPKAVAAFQMLVASAAQAANSSGLNRSQGNGAGSNLGRGRGGSTESGGFAALQSFFEPPGSPKSSDSRSKSAAPSSAATPQSEARSAAFMTNQVPSSSVTTTPTNRAPVAPIAATSAVPVESSSAVEVMATANTLPLNAEPMERSFNWLLLMLLVLVSAGLLGAVLERRRRQRRHLGSDNAD